MDNIGGDPPASDQAQTELTISLAASSMINASNPITAEAYQANLKRIEEVKKMVRRLEMNNEVAHKNFLVDELQKRAKDGREAEDMLARLSNQPGPSETVQFTNNTSSSRPEVILPTTATLVEVPESHSSQTMQQSRPKHQRKFPTQIQPYHNPLAFRHYAPPPQPNAVPHAQVPIVQGQGLYTLQNQPSQSWIHNPPAQAGSEPIQPTQSWIGYPPQAVALSAPDIPRWTVTPPVHGDPSAGTSNHMYRLPATPVTPVYGLSPHVGSHPKPVESQSRSIPTQPVAISALRLPHKPPPQPQLHEPKLQQWQPPPPPLPKPSSESQQQSQQSQVQRPLQMPRKHHQAAPSPASRVPTRIFPPNTQPSQPPRPTIVPEQARQRDTQPHMDQATFVKLFQNAVQHGPLELKAFWFQAKAHGITDQWFNVAINSLPRNVWQSVVAQAYQLPSTPNAAPIANAPQQQATPDGLSVPTVNAPPPLAATSFAQMAPATQRVIKPSIFTEENVNSGSRQFSEKYAAQMRYYAEQATKTTLSAQAANIMTPSPGNVAPAQTTLAIQRDMPRIGAHVRTPRDANKSTLARDVLYALGKIVQKSSQVASDEPADKFNNHEDNQPPEVTSPRPISRPVSPKPPIVPSTSSVDANSLSIPLENYVQDVPQCATPTHQSIAKSVQAIAIEGPIMIDLTSDDSGESIGGKGKNPTFPVQSPASVGVPLQPVSPTNTTNHTPLLESLSLEEAPVDTAGANDNADVRMHSPLLSPVAKKSMKSELLHVPPGNAEPALLNFELLPSEPNELPLDGQLPLFLPSPSASPAPTERPARDPEMINDEDESRASLKRRSVEVDKMEIDTEMTTPLRVRKRQKQQVYVLIPLAPPYIRKAKMKERAMGKDIESVSEGVRQDEELQYSHLEQLLIKESKLRLLERRCQWLNCGAILNCAANLLAHLKNHAREEALQDSFLCRWTGCKKQFNAEQERDAHLERHTIKPLPCPFAGCNKQFDKPVEVMQHEVQHQVTDCRELLIHKRTCEPIVPGIPARLGPAPQWLPSHRVIPRRVAKCQISADRHAIVGPWVLWNIFSPVDLNTRKQNASMRGRPTRQATNYDIDSSDARRDDYDFLLALSSYSAKGARLDDLDSTLITMSAARGLTLWGSGAIVNGSPNPEENTNVHDVNTDGTDGNEARGKSNSPEVSRSVVVTVGEEDAVERL